MWPFKKRDWVTVWTERGAWVCQSIFGGGEYAEICTYRILYSKSRGKFKLQTEGLNPSAHSKYNIAKDKLREYNNSTT